MMPDSWDEEEYFDKVIHPLLLKVKRLCRDHNMPLFVVVGFGFDAEKGHAMGMMAFGDDGPDHNRIAPPMKGALTVYKVMLDNNIGDFEIMEVPESGHDRPEVYLN